MSSQPRQGQRVPGLSAGLPKDIYLASVQRRVDWTRVGVIGLGLLLLLAACLLPRLPDAVDAQGQRFALGREGQAALGMFVLAALWWAFEVVPIGVTGIAVGVIQVLLRIRPPKAAMGDFLDPAIWFVFGSLAIGVAFYRTGLTQRLAYRMLMLFGERTHFIYLGATATTAVLSLLMAHTAAAAVLFPLLMALYPLYDDGRRPTRFGKGLFIGMSAAASAASIPTLLGSARAALAAGFFEQMTVREVSFFELSYYLLPLGWVLALVFWLLMLAQFPPEKKRIGGLRERLELIHRKLGPISAQEITALAIVGAMLVALGLGQVTPRLALNKSGLIAAATVALFLFDVLKIEDLEAIPWNIVLLFGAATSLGLCLWQTGAARWLAVQGLAVWGHAPPLAFILAFAVLALVLTNFVVNVAVLALVLPVELASAAYLGLAPEVVFYTTLAAAGLPLLLLAGSAPNAMAFESRQFSAREFLRAGLPSSAASLAVLALFVRVVWPWMGMPIGVR